MINLDLPVSALELEITETVVISDSARTNAILEQLRALGVRKAIDDGTGCASLAYFAALPVSDLKIDQISIRAMDGGGPAVQRAGSISTIAFGLGLGYIAKGFGNSVVARRAHRARL